MCVQVSLYLYRILLWYSLWGRGPQPQQGTGTLQYLIIFQNSSIAQRVFLKSAISPPLLFFVCLLFSCLYSCFFVSVTILFNSCFVCLLLYCLYSCFCVSVTLLFVLLFLCVCYSVVCTLVFVCMLLCCLSPFFCVMVTLMFSLLFLCVCYSIVLISTFCVSVTLMFGLSFLFVCFSIVWSLLFVCLLL